MGDWGQGLTEPERALLASLSVFSGGFTMEAAAAVACAHPGLAGQVAAALVPDLARRRLLIQAAPGRFELPGPVRAGAAGALAAGPHADEVRSRHLAWARALAEQGAAQLDGAGQQTWFDALEAEHDNFRAALAWGTARDGCEAALALAAALGRFWEVRGHVEEGRRWLDDALRRNPEAATAVRANASNSAALLALRDADLAAARSIYEESLALHWVLDDRLGASGVLHALGNVAFQRAEWDEAERLFEESLNIGRQLDDARVVAASLTNLGAVADVRGDHGAARALYGDALERWRAVGDRFNASAVLANLAEVAAASGDLAGARELALEALEARRAVGDQAGAAASLRTLARIAGRQGDHRAARSFEAERRRLVGERAPSESWLAHLRRRLGR